MIALKNSDIRSGQSRRNRLRACLAVTLTLGSTLSFTAGCQSTGTSSVAFTPTHDIPESIDSVVAADEFPHAPATAVKTVAFQDEPTLQDLMALDLPDPRQQQSAPSRSFDNSSHGPGLTLAEIEAIALSNNPTIAELAATTQTAAGFKDQVGQRANPTMGYSGAQIADEGTDQHTIFISQTIITGEKLALNRSVLNEALRSQLLELEAQKYRIATDIRITFYEALASQRRVELIRDFQSVVKQGLELAEQLKAAQEGSQLEVVQAKVQKSEIELALQQAQVRYQSAWRELAALAGNPEMTPVVLIGELPASESTLDWAAVAASTIAASPEVQAAQARVDQARANVCRQEIQPLPNLDVQFAAGVDNATHSGLINLQVGAPIPVFNKNQGNISAARAEYARASHEVERIENSIKARLASVSRDFGSALVAVEQYSQNILPHAEESLKLAELAYQAGETSFVQVLVARRTYFESNLQYINSQTQLAQARARVDGFVLSGALDAVVDKSGDDSLRGLTFSQE